VCVRQAFLCGWGWKVECATSLTPSLCRLIKFCSETKDPLVPSVWGKLDDRDNHYREKGAKCTIL
jgi:hypothetical protein